MSKVEDVKILFEQVINSNPEPTQEALEELAKILQGMIPQGNSVNMVQGGQNGENTEIIGGRRSSKKRGTQRKQKRRQRRGSRRAY